MSTPREPIATGKVPAGDPAAGSGTAPGTAPGGARCVVVALTGGPESATLLSRGARFASRVGADLHAVIVSRPGQLAEAAPASLDRLRRLTEELGGSYHTVVADDVAEAVLDLARGVNAATIVVGVSRANRWTVPFRAGVSRRIVAGSGDIDVLMVTHPYSHHAAGSAPALLGRNRLLAGWVLAVTGPVLLTVALLVQPSGRAPTFEALGYTAWTVMCAMVGGLWPALTTALLSSLMLNYYFTPPLRTLTIADTSDVVALMLFLLVGAAVASVVGLAARRSQQAQRARREADTLSMLNHTVLRGDQNVTALLGLVRDTFAMRSASLLRRDDAGAADSADTGDGWTLIAGSGDAPPRTPAQGDASAEASPTTRLVLSGRPLPAQDLRVLAAFATHLAVVVDRATLAAQTATAQRLEEGNRLRTALLAAVSHDLRTPLAGIKAAVSTLRTPDVTWSPDDSAELLAAIEDSTDRLGAIIANLLDMSRLQTGAVHLVTRDVGTDDVVLRALRNMPGADRVDLDVPVDLPAVHVDVGLLERVTANLVENAVRHSPPEARVTVSARADGTRVRLSVVDHGPGVSDAEKARLFQPFQRLGDARAGEGVGLGLAVAQGLTGVLGGRLTAQDTPGGGLTMVVDLPAVEPAPQPEAPGDAVAPGPRTSPELVEP